MNASQQRHLIEERLQRMSVVMATSESARALETERTYVNWMRRFMVFSFTQPDLRACTPEELARRFVEAHARDWSIATQDQFRNAISFDHSAGLTMQRSA